MAFKLQMASIKQTYAPKCIPAIVCVCPATDAFCQSELSLGTNTSVFIDFCGFSVLAEWARDRQSKKNLRMGICRYANVRCAGTDSLFSPRLTHVIDDTSCLDLISVFHWWMQIWQLTQRFLIQQASHLTNQINISKEKLRVSSVWENLVGNRQYLCGKVRITPRHVFVQNDLRTAVNIWRFNIHSFPLKFSDLC